MNKLFYLVVNLYHTEMVMVTIFQNMYKQFIFFQNHILKIILKYVIFKINFRCDRG